MQGTKPHQACTRSWSAFEGLRHALVKTLAFLKSPGMMARFLQTFQARVREPGFVIITNGPLSVEALSFRNKFLQVFGPEDRAGVRNHATVRHLCKTLFSGDWRVVGKLEHRCEGASCCERGLPSAISKFEEAVPLLLAALRLERFELGNWNSWQRQLSMVGLLCAMHGLFQHIFLLAFSPGRPWSHGCADGC